MEAADFGTQKSVRSGKKRGMLFRAPKPGRKRWGERIFGGWGRARTVVSPNVGTRGGFRGKKTKKRL